MLSAFKGRQSISKESSVFWFHLTLLQTQKQGLTGHWMSILRLCPRWFYLSLRTRRHPESLHKWRRSPWWRETVSGMVRKKKGNGRTCICISLHLSNLDIQKAGRRRKWDFLTMRHLGQGQKNEKGLSRKKSQLNALGRGNSPRKDPAEKKEKICFKNFEKRSWLWQRGLNLFSKVTHTESRRDGILSQLSATPVSEGSAFSPCSFHSALG